MENKKAFTQDLLMWYDDNARELPWRSHPTPYHVWVSEIMLQQTRVEAVKAYYQRFLKRFPSMASLALANDDELYKQWEGLGYYNRVRNMKKCAQICVEKYNGTLPATYDELLRLPGIGTYTAGAIASIAYKEVVAAVDGNVLRVFSRLLMSEDDVLKEATKKKFQSIIYEYIPSDRPDAFNQALMEIGALVCVPNAIPRCNICPLMKHCQGYKDGKAQSLPIKKAKKMRKVEKKTILICVYDKQVRLQKRASTGLLADMYEFPSLQGFYTKKQLHEKFPKAFKIKKLSRSKHLFTHIEWQMEGYMIEMGDADMSGLVNYQEMQDCYAVPSAFKEYKDALYEYWGK
ncbi:MAG: A/G-specific adenine glycosylase [Breznakia sp.]